MCVCLCVYVLTYTHMCVCVSLSPAISPKPLYLRKVEASCLSNNWSQPIELHSLSLVCLTFPTEIIRTEGSMAPIVDIHQDSLGH